MARIAGVDIPREKRTVIALTYIFGVGPTTAEQICAATGIDESTRVKDLSEADVNKLRAYIDQNLTAFFPVDQVVGESNALPRMAVAAVAKIKHNPPVFVP